MTTKSINARECDLGNGKQFNEEIVLDMQTICSRIHQIKKSWNEQTRKMRAEEGVKRRAELESLLGIGAKCATKVRTAEPTKISHGSTLNSLRLFSNAV